MVISCGLRDSWTARLSMLEGCVPGTLARPWQLYTRADSRDNEKSMLKGGHTLHGYSIIVSEGCMSLSLHVCFSFEDSFLDAGYVRETGAVSECLAECRICVQSDGYRRSRY